MIRNRNSIRCLGLFILVSLIGCGGIELGTVEGNVTVDGKPTKGIEVTFEPVGTEGGTAIGYTNADGHYALQFPGRRAGAPPGEYVVRLAGGELDDSGPAIKIPAKYNSESELKRTVESGTNTFDFEIERQ